MLVGVSHAQLKSAPPELGRFEVIPNPIDVSAWPLQERKDDYLLWIGRMTPEKGPHRAIAAASNATSAIAGGGLGAVRMRGERIGFAAGRTRVEGVGVGEEV